MSAPARPRGRPKREDRAQAQRERILDAARRCFVEQGFHAASMAHIAETAGMSAGLIYRYFDSKNAIILAIIASQLEERRERIDSLRDIDQLGERVLELFHAWRHGDDSGMNAALFLEMSAEATRDAQIAAALAASDDEGSRQFTEWMRREATHRGLQPDDTELQARRLILQCFIEGLALRAVRQPGLDPAFIDAAIRRLLPRVFDYAG
ncbi:MAG: TetR/AcrR family transcriptional regulator [Xanthomonadales bacterium]|nr:TetR/AcrR family transcriptional regulator [Xanthomonadales bacterium]